MKYLKPFEQHRIDESKILDLLKSGVSLFIQKLKSLKGKAYLKMISTLIPKELKELIFSEVKKLKTQNESILLEELLDKELFLTDEEIDKMSEEEYDSYLKKLAEISSRNPLLFSTQLGGDFNPKDKEVLDFFKEKGFQIDTSIKYDFKPSIQTINQKIEKMNVSSISKRTLKILCLIFFIVMLISIPGQAIGKALDTDGPLVKTYDDESTKILDNSVDLKFNYIDANTDKEECPNFKLTKFGLENPKEVFYETTIGDLKSKIGGDTTQILSNCKPINLPIKATDYLQVGERNITDNGSIVFSIKDDSTKVIAKRNGLLALTRFVRESKPDTEYDFVKVSFKQPRQSDEVKVDLEPITPRQISAINTVYKDFKVSITEDVSKFDPTSYGKVRAPHLIGTSDESKIDSLTKEVNIFSKYFVPRSDTTDYGFSKMDREVIKDLYFKYKASGNVDKDQFKEDFIKVYKNLLIQNVEKYCQKKFPKEISDRIVKKVKNGIPDSIKSDSNVYAKSEWKTITSKEIDIQQSKTKYKSGN